MTRSATGARSPIGRPRARELHACAAALRQADIARRAGLLEPLCDALLLQARAASVGGRPGVESLGALREAADLADTQGLADAAWRAHEMLSQMQPDPAQLLAASQARRRLELEFDGSDAVFDAIAARQREPRLDLSPH